MEEKDKELDLLDILLDEDNEDPIVLVDDDDKEVSFEQVALIPINSKDSQKLYAILKPIDKVDGVADDEAIVFRVEYDEEEKEPTTLTVEEDDSVIDLVFSEYTKLLDSEEN